MRFPAFREDGGNAPALSPAAEAAAGTPSRESAEREITLGRTKVRPYGLSSNEA